MKLLVFAHVPPPHHGQSYMVRVMLDGLGGDHRRRGKGAVSSTPYGIECYHVDSRLSQKLEDIGDVRIAKFVLLLGFCLQAIWCRFRYGVTNLYYIPAPGKFSALYRDWLVMFLCRPFFKNIILHWHAAGMSKWLERVAQIRTRSLTYRLMKQVDLSIVLSRYNQGDAEKLFARRIAVVGNGIPDPCPDFETALRARRVARQAARAKLVRGQALTPAETAAAGGDPQVFKVLFLAHCTREKGLFDAVDGVALANRQLADAGSPLSLQLVVAGDFVNAGERAEFEARTAEPDLRLVRGEETPPAAGGTGALVRLVGFVGAAAKKRVLEEADCFCFPTFYYAENFPLVLAEAMAAGMLVITTRWRSIPELLPADYPGLVEIRSPGQIAEKLRLMLTLDMTGSLRERFAENFTVERHLASLASALHSVESPGDPVPAGPQLSGAPAR